MQRHGRLPQDRASFTRTRRLTRYCLAGVMGACAPRRMPASRCRCRRCVAMCMQQGRTVVTTIHQPNGAITRCFDDLLLLTKGQLVYSGPWTNAVDYFDALGFK